MIQIKGNGRWLCNLWLQRARSYDVCQRYEPIEAVNGDNIVEDGGPAG